MQYEVINAKINAIMDAPNLLLISGTGRQSGKTTVASSLIRRFAPDFDIVALKITPHFHEVKSARKKLFSDENLRIYREYNPYSAKDTSRMMSAGAMEIYLMQANEQGLAKGFEKFTEMIKPGSPVICESPALRKIVNPGVFILMHQPENTNVKADVLAQKELADIYFDYIPDFGDEALQNIKFQDKNWKL